MPGLAFGVNGGGQRAMRLNFSNAAPEMIAEGVRRLGGLVQAVAANQRMGEMR